MLRESASRALSRTPDKLPVSGGKKALIESANHPKLTIRKDEPEETNLTLTLPHVEVPSEVRIGTDNDLTILPEVQVFRGNGESFALGKVDVQTLVQSGDTAPSYSDPPICTVVDGCSGPCKQNSNEYKLCAK